MRGYALLAACSVLGLAALTGCSSPQRTITAAPPVAPAPASAPPMASAPAGGVYDWRDVPMGEQVPVIRAVFDQAGYQIYAAGGETIVVPFANQNLYVMRFGRSLDGSTYFINESGVPTLYLPREGFLENAVAQGARWYPLPRDYVYTRPVYVSFAPSWRDYTGMGWYPGMHVYGGMWGYTPAASFTWMPGFYFNVGGSRYNDFVSYRTYYTSHRGYVPNRVVYRNYTPTRRTVSSGFGSGSLGSGRSSGFGSTRSMSGSTGSFGSGRMSSGFGSGRSSGFGSSSGTGSFGNSRTGSAPTGSFTGGASGYSSSGRSTGRSFGGTRSFGGSFGSGSRSTGGSSFGSGNSSSSSGSFGRSSGSFGGGSSSSFRSSGSSSFGGGRSSSSSSFGSGRSSSSGSFGRRR